MEHLINWIRIIFALTIIFVIGCNSLTRSPKGAIEETTDLHLVNDTLSFKDSVELYIKEINIKHPELVLTQAVLESGHFTSDIFKENNNLFGMKKAYHRPHVQTGVNRGHATYDSWKMSIVDYALYQTYVAKGMSLKDYQAFIGKHYAEDPLYSQKIKHR